MKALNQSALKSSGYSLPLLPSVNLRRPSISKALSAGNPKPPFFAGISHRNPNRRDYGVPQRVMKFKQDDASELSLTPIWTVLNKALATAVVGAAILFSRFYFYAKPAIAAAPISAGVQAFDGVSASDEDGAKSVEENIVSNIDDVGGLKKMMEANIKGKKIPEAIEILDKLMELEPNETEWPLLKYHLYAVNGGSELAMNGFNELIKKDPFLVEAYHGLVTVFSQYESTEGLKEIEKRVEEAIKLCKEMKKDRDLRDFKLLIAQMKVLDSKYEDALKVYQELVKEEPRDFRPYLCQGMIYTLLRKDREAEKSFEKYVKLVPREHPYVNYFDDNMTATKVFAGKMESERAVSKS